jgi:REP element-mobilizing transposase RayT
MTRGLIRYHQAGCFHFVTFSCYHRLAYLGTATARRLFERSLEAMRKRYDFVVCGYVVMPEHVHLLLSEPKEALLSKAIQALKLSVSVQSRQRPFGRRGTTTSMFTTKRNVWRSCGTCTGTQSRADWLRSLSNGAGRASCTTRPVWREPWRSKVSGPLRGAGMNSRNFCAHPGRLVEGCGLPGLPPRRTRPGAPRCLGRIDYGRPSRQHSALHCKSSYLRRRWWLARDCVARRG